LAEATRTMNEATEPRTPPAPRVTLEQKQAEMRMREGQPAGTRATPRKEHPSDMMDRAAKRMEYAREDLDKARAEGGDITKAENEYISHVRTWAQYANESDVKESMGQIRASLGEDRVRVTKMQAAASRLSQRRLSPYANATYKGETL